MLKTKTFSKKKFARNPALWRNKVAAQFRGAAAEW
jgi:hypothetical protein